MADSHPRDNTTRLIAIEETVGFNEHRAQQLDALVAELSSQVYELSGRLARMEKKLSDLQTDVQSHEGAAPSNDPPPHSHRPL